MERSDFHKYSIFTIQFSFYIGIQFSLFNFNFINGGKDMKIFRNRAVVFAIFLFFVAALSCGKEKESRKVDLDKKTSDVSRLVKTTDMKKSLTFCFDSRLDPYEEIKTYGSFLDYLEKETGLDFTLFFSKSYQETIKNIGTGEAQFAIIGGLSFLNAEHDYGVRMLVNGLGQNGSGIAVNKDVSEKIADKVKTALLQFDPAGKHKAGLINWDKTEMSGGFSDVKPQNYDVLKKMAEKYKVLGDD
jgi:ABC-type phosphate/phosphonate transport system substrate-binding protein